MRTQVPSPPLRIGWSSDSRSALFWHGGVNASSSRRAISTFTVSRPPNAVAWLIAYTFGLWGTTQIWISVRLAHIAVNERRFSRSCISVWSHAERKKKKAKIAAGWWLYVTLAGLMPVSPALAACFWIWWSWQILSFSSWAVSLAAVHTASPQLRPFTSTALTAATSLAPHTLRIKHSDSHTDIWWESCL